MAEQINPTDVQALRYIQQKQQEVNKFFKEMQFKNKDFEQSQSNTTNQPNQSKIPKPVNKMPNYHVNYRGQKIYSVEDLRKKYENAIIGTKWWSLPYCRRTILGKIQFWCGASFIFTFMWGNYYMRKNNVANLGFKFYRNTYGFFALASCAYVFIESMLFEPYCDINSYHYKSNDNLLIAKDIKKQLREIYK